jgi:hypothetical protein
MQRDARANLEIRVAAQRKRNWQAWLAGLLVIALLVTSYLFGKRQAGVEWREATRQAASLQQSLQSLADDNARLKHELDFARASNARQQQISRQAREEINASLLASSEQIAELQENLRFYERIIHRDSADHGLQIRELQVNGPTADGSYSYALVIVDGDFGKKDSQGRASLLLEGDSEVEQAQVVPGSEGEMLLRFRYFQRLAGSFQLPDGFTPKRLKVTVSLTGRKARQIEKWYDWRSLLTEKRS